MSGTGIRHHRAAHSRRKSAVGGPLALVKDGDMIRLDVAKRSIDLLVDADRDRKNAGAALGAARDAGMGQARLRASVQRDHFCRPTKAAIFDFMRVGGKG